MAAHATFSPNTRARADTPTHKLAPAHATMTWDLMSSDVGLTHEGQTAHSSTERSSPTKPTQHRYALCILTTPSPYPLFTLALSAAMASPLSPAH